MMRLAAGVFAISGLVCAGQTQSPANDETVRVHRMTVVANDLPEAERQQIVTATEGGTYRARELEERVGRQLREAGYYFAQVEAPQITDIRKQGAVSEGDVSIKVQAGAVYHMGEVSFTGATVFKPEQLRGQVAMKPGSVFQSSAVNKGIEQLKNLYEGAGYAAAEAVPVVQVDEARHTLDVTIQINEGNPYAFGQLLLDGREPSEGAAKALLTSWKELEGRRYDPVLLRRWLAASTAGWPKGTAAQAHADGVEDAQMHLINVVLHFR